MQSKHDDEVTEAWTCEEQIHLIRAPDADTAYKKAMDLGKKREHSYKNVYDETVSWTFLGLEDLAELDGQLRDGIEIRYRFFRHKDPISLVSAKDNLFGFRGNAKRETKENRILSEELPFHDE
jgi:hypothetical protein